MRLDDTHVVQSARRVFSTELVEALNGRFGARSLFCAAVKEVVLEVGAHGGVENHGPNDCEVELVTPGFPVIHGHLERAAVGRCVLDAGCELDTGPSELGARLNRIGS